MDDKEFFARGNELAMKLVGFAEKQGYDQAELWLASKLVKSAAERSIAIDAIFGDKADDVRDALWKMQADKAIEEAEEALRNGDQ